MAPQARSSSASLETQLFERGHEFSFAQAVRLLRLLAAPQAGEDVRPCGVRVRPELSLSFPVADVARIERQGDGYRITARFLGLYGPSSPLPTFYTEELMDEEREDGSASRNFLDVLSHRIFDLWVAGDAKYCLFNRVVEDGSGDDLERLFCLAGLDLAQGQTTLPESGRWLRYAGLLGQVPRSALGLRTMAADALGVPVEVIPCQHRQVPIPPEQRLAVGAAGSSLGIDTVVGTDLDDRLGMFRLCLGPLSREQFADLLPGAPGRSTLELIVELYLDAPLAWDVVLTLAPGETPEARLGACRGARVGWDTWLGAAAGETLSRVVFPGHIP